MADALFQIDQLQEDIDIEAKRAGGKDGKGALPNDVWETYSAFANTDGGLILLGVSEKDQQFIATGIAQPDRVIDDFWKQANNPQKASRNLLGNHAVVKHPLTNGRWVIAIEVPRASRRDRPVFINGNPLTGTYKRLKTGDYRCSETEVRRMLAEQTEDERDARLLHRYDFDDIDLDTLKAYRNKLASLKPDHPYNSVENTDFLRKLGGWRKDRDSGEAGLTLAGLLMFGRQESIHEMAPNLFLDYRELPVSGSKTEWVDRLTPDGTWSGNLYDFYRLVIQRLFRDLKVPFRLEGVEREDETAVHKALREALVNTIVHADYSASVSLLVVKAPDYFGFRNPGRMRIPISQALEGGNSDCRNRSLQKMFSLIGLGEQAGSGIPRVLENWKTQHYRAPELWETQEPESTLMRMRTVSLLPQETLTGLRHRFGKAFDGLDEQERMAVVTAQIEGFVTNGRLQQLCILHPRDLTDLLKRLENQGFLEHDGHGRGSTYRIAGTPAIDLARASDLTEPSPSPEHLGDSSEHLGDSSEHLGDSSEHSGDSSEHLGDSSEHLGDSSEHSGTQSTEPVNDPALMAIAEPVRSNGKVALDVTREVILQLCDGRFLTLNQLAGLLSRSPDGLRQRFIKPMVDDEKVLERRFPQQPNHEKQAYRTQGS
jgi:predicted HTH transcriptional regulator